MEEFSPVSLLVASPRQNPVSDANFENQDEDGEDRGFIEDEDEDEYLRWSLNPERPRKISEKKRRDHAKFQSWIESNQDKVLEAGPDASKEPNLGSVAHLLKQENERFRIIQTPREYQIELFERAKSKNTIVVLDTGSGKTLIAALLLRHILEKEIEDRATGQQKRIAFFLVDKVSLVFQQHAVLECNLEHPVARFCGDMVDEMWSREFWAQKFEENMVIVCTAAILQKCLTHSYIRMEQINLLIFDEAHHTKKNHPYARIIKDFYIKEPDANKRPRILGMTASPVDAQTDIKIAIAQLECLLHSEIATVSEESLSRDSHVRKITEKEIHYSSLPMPYETELYQKINALVGRNQHFSKELCFAKAATSSLGPWAADRFWQLFLTDEAIVRLTQRTEMSYSGLGSADRETAAVQKLRDVVRTHEFKPATPTLDQVSMKVLRLWEELRPRFTSEPKYRCIVFVEMRLTAVLLADLFKQNHIKLSYLNPAVLVGSQSDTGLANMSFKQQVLTIHRFRHAEVNCLFATQVAEEGLDIPDCNLIMRFDLYKSVIQYIQSKGRARRQDSEYISFIEGGNGRQARMVLQATYDQSVLRRFCNALPEDKKIMGFDVKASILKGDLHYKSYLIKSTGAVLTWTSSLEVLANFAASLRQSNDEVCAPEYVVINQGQTFVAEVQLPERSPIMHVAGFPQSNKQAARCSAAFEMCKELIKKKYIDHNLQPVFTKKLPAMRNARLAVSSNKRAEYKMRTKPDIWFRLGPFSHLYVNILVLATPDAVGRNSKPLLLLTREKLPDLPAIPLFFGNDQQSEAFVVALPAPIQVSETDSELLKSFTFRIFKDMFSKEYEAPIQNIPYFLAPTRRHHSEDLARADAATLIDWVHLRETKDREYLEWDDNAAEEFFQDKLVIDPYAGSRKFYLRGVRKDMKPTDPVPEGAPDPGHRPWRDPAVEKNIKEYSVSMWMKSRAKRTWRDTQPVVEAEVVSLRRNLLDDFVEVTTEESKICYIILEPLRVSTLPIETVVMAFTFPAIIHRIDAVLIALDACKFLDLDIRPDLALEAVTKDSDNSDEHGKNKINFQGGMGKNYEQLEFLGDCFLKMATTIALFTQNPEDNEFAYHVERMLLICNQNLFNKAVDRSLPEYVRSKSFDRRSWYPSGLRLIRGKEGSLNHRHALADKSIADVCEALIGAAYLSYAETNNFDMAIRAVTAMVKNKNHLMTSWGDYYTAYTPSAWQSGHSTAMQKELARQIKENLGYEFKYPALLRSAFKHPSYPRAYEDLPNYQRLEFLGDALLDMVCVDFLFKKFPDADPQWLTEHKTAMVSNQFLACLCVQLGLHKHVLSGHASLLNQTQDFVGVLECAKQDAAADGTFSQCYWIHVKQAPKFLSDVVEAYIGALFVDSGYDYGQVRGFFDAHIRPFFTDMALYDSFASRHPVTNLTRILQDDLGCQEWRLMVSEVAPSVEEGGAAAITGSHVLCGVILHGQIHFHAAAASGRYAKVAAAKRAVEKLENMDVGAFRKEYGCDCDAQGGENTIGDHGTAV
ncbi:RNase3 domain-containing protein [Colletotrichum graminicola M1.001]|uniref:Dicer-like protein 1 n=1 Tax=Colletotrichum graminicola (strain M1.001 / M2 / FGSC 10212) TaxID=645133 RepID=E3QQT2_COLGM|nr:RNase3 domain-containing protein [Colletotrichum graminicola M1.001]EFQ33220.1 RNase3 domain-containing protein [Colletotrichum graminicola M1.001]